MDAKFTIVQRRMNVSDKKVEYTVFEVRPIHYILTIRSLLCGDYELYFKNNDEKALKIGMGDTITAVFNRNDTDYTNCQHYIIDKIEKIQGVIKVTGRDMLASLDYIGVTVPKISDLLTILTSGAPNTSGSDPACLMVRPDKIEVFNSSGTIASEVGKSIYENVSEFIYNNKMYHAFRDNLDPKVQSIYLNKIGAIYGTNYDNKIHITIRDNDAFYKTESLRDGKTYIESFYQDEKDGKIVTRAWGKARANNNYLDGSAVVVSENYSGLKDTNKTYDWNAIVAELTNNSKSKVSSNTIGRISSLDKSVGLQLLKNYEFIRDYSINTVIVAHLPDNSTKNYYIAEIEINNNIVSGITLNAL